MPGLLAPTASVSGTISRSRFGSGWLAPPAVLLSFVVIGLFARSGRRDGGYHRVNLLRWRRLVLADRRMRLGAQVVAVGLLVLVVTAGLFGDQNPTRNFAPIWVWVVWWVGFAVSALAGNLWAVVNPWATIFGWVEAFVGRADNDTRRAVGRTFSGSGCGPRSASSPPSPGSS